jgi:hypothetical protein
MVTSPNGEGARSRLGLEIACPADLAPCNFYLFGHIKGRLAGASFEESNQLLHAIDVIFQSIGQASLERVFQEWMDRLVQYCLAFGGLIEST